MRLALCAGTFASEIETGKSTLEEIFKLAHQYGFDDLELRDDLLNDHSGSVAQLLEWADEYRLNLIYAFKLWPLHKDLSKMKENEPLFRQALHTAQTLGAKILKVGFGTLDTVEEWSDEHTLLIREWLKSAEESQITVCLENGRQQPELIAAVLNHINHPHLMTTFDTGNYAQAGVQAERAAQLLASRTGYVHLKDVTLTGNKTWLGDGAISFPAIFEILRAHAYIGPWCFEFPMSVDRLDEIDRSLEYMKPYFLN